VVQVPVADARSALGANVLVEGTSRVLPALPRSLSAKARRSLERLGVTVQAGRLVAGIDPEAAVPLPRRLTPHGRY
jgi:NADH dehydrogenase FAD-containing subunit